jgi:Flp pilus assembly protein TadD
VISQQDPAAALQAVNRALAIKPENVEARETRGMILLQLGQWQQAVNDLELVLNGRPGSVDVHKGLAKAYQQLGNRRLAEVHRRQAESASTQ